MVGICCDEFNNVDVQADNNAADLILGLIYFSILLYAFLDHACDKAWQRWWSTRITYPSKHPRNHPRLRSSEQLGDKTLKKRLTPWLQALYANKHIYIITTVFTQLSLLLLYKRVFTMHRAWFRNTLYGIAFASLISNLSCLLVVVFQCNPIKKAWDRQASGYCIQDRIWFISHAALTLVIDVSIVAAPMPLIWTLHRSSRYKAAVGGIFFMGSLSVFLSQLHRPANRSNSVCIINVIKIHYYIYLLTGDVSC